MYRAGYVGRCLFFVSSGKIKITLSDDRSTLDSFGIQALRLLLHKQNKHGQYYLPGDHFGEYCLISKSGLRPDTAYVEHAAEVYTLSKQDLWTIFLSMTYTDRRSFLLELFCRIGENYHIADHDLHNVNCEDEEVGRDDARIKFLYRLAFRVMSELIEELDEQNVLEASEDRDTGIIEILRDDSTKHFSMSPSDRLDHGQDFSEFSSRKRRVEMNLSTAMPSRISIVSPSDEESQEEELLTSKSRRNSTQFVYPDSGEVSRKNSFSFAESPQSSGKYGSPGERSRGGSLDVHDLFVDNSPGRRSRAAFIKTFQGTMPEEKNNIIEMAPIIPSLLDTTPRKISRRHSSFMPRSFHNESAKKAKEDSDAHQKPAVSWRYGFKSSYLSVPNRRFSTMDLPDHSVLDNIEEEKI